jgi:DNA-binding XRE family transcriptional regulator
MSTTLEDVATRAAELAIQSYRQEAKRGREDSGSGSKEVGNILRHWRIGRSVTELARESGLHHTTIGKIESGQRGMSVQTLAKLSQVLPPEFVGQVLRQIAEEASDDSDD